MPRSNSRPGGNSRPQRSRRPGRAGNGPGPAYRPSSSGGGTSHKSGSATRRQIAVAAFLFIVAPGLLLSSLAAFLLHGYGVL